MFARKGLSPVSLSECSQSRHVQSSPLIRYTVPSMVTGMIGSAAQTSGTQRCYSRPTASKSPVSLEQSSCSVNTESIMLPGLRRCPSRLVYPCL